MIDLYYWPTPNGRKVSIVLEEMELEYRVVPVNIRRGDQTSDSFTRVSPNQRIPAIVDHDPEDGGEPLSIFESGGILVYLAEKCGKFLPRDPRGRSEALQWVFWQVGGLGPMLGQHGHFKLYAETRIPYATERYEQETRRLYGVLNRQLQDREYIAGSYSIADMACWPWIITHKRQEITLDVYPHLRRWYDDLKQRPRLRRGYDVGQELANLAAEDPDEEARKILFGPQNGASPGAERSET